jgi:hypothetical protein
MVHITYGIPNPQITVTAFLIVSQFMKAWYLFGEYRIKSSDDPACQLLFTSDNPIELCPSVACGFPCHEFHEIDRFESRYGDALTDTEEDEKEDDDSAEHLVLMELN